MLLQKLFRGSHTVLRKYSNNKSERLIRKYEKMVQRIEETAPVQGVVDPRGVFANSELDLNSVNVYGFDYDYTLAVYTKNLNSLIYSLAMDSLIYKYKYPSGIRDIPYAPEFAVRGLHFDIQKGMLMKLDAFAAIQEGTVYRGMQPVPFDEVMKQYPGLRIPTKYLEEKGPKSLKQLSDLFSLPEIGLLATVVEYFEQNNFNYDPLPLFYDVQAAITDVHISGVMYQEVSNNMKRYVHFNDGLRAFFARLVANRKTTFIMTNSPFHFINAGMNYLIGTDWRTFFDYVVVKAKKPRFFEDSHTPFRLFNTTDGTESWERVSDLVKGQVYTGGNINEFVQKTGLYPRKVLYFGDHIQTDLMDPMLKFGWATGAIIPELGREIATQNRVEYKKGLLLWKSLSQLIDKEQHDRSDPDVRAILEDWNEEQITLRRRLKEMFNPQFGSIFRTWLTPTYFSQRLMRMADIYTDRLPNLLKYNVDHCFHPYRYPLQHEPHHGIVLPG